MGEGSHGCPEPKTAGSAQPVVAEEDLDRSRSIRGAIYVEFLVAFFPLLTLFMGIVQIADLYQASLIVHHAATTGVRAAMVVLPDDPQFYGGVAVNTVDGKRREDIEKAVSYPLRASRSLTELRVTFPAQAGGSDSKTSFESGDLVRVQVQARFQCRVPFVNRLVCGAKTGMRTITAEAAMPNQGAPYEYP